MKNPYYDSDQLPVEMFLVSDLDADYSFDYMIFLRDRNTGIVFFAYDSGCSCPKPFEDYEGTDWNEVRSKMERVTLREALKKLESYNRRADKTPTDLKKWWKKKSDM